MKINNITLSNFKQFEKETSFRFNVAPPSETASDRTLILGNNGTGKSTILQAIALVTATATRVGFTPEQLDWPGFVLDRIQSGEKIPKVICSYQFSQDEIEATSQYVQQLQDSGHTLLPPSTHTRVELFYSHDRSVVQASKGQQSYFQFKGYQYAKQLAKATSNKNALFEQVGNIYWYTEQRTSYSISNLLDTSAAQQLDDLRVFLSQAYTFHVAIQHGRPMKEGEFDFFEELQDLYTTIFPDRRLIGSAPDFNQFEKNSIPDFFFSDGRHQYEIAEMSAGERAIFPLLLDFARWNINHSIVIIDEVEIHLHPPLQQALIRALPKLGTNNQFIFTSHSDSVATMFSEDQIIHL